ncbi:MAG: diguanylate cyclase [Rhodospirillum sp.]|nr:diguanylate cyclase [Rhodospirillum sp.]MCF8491222.1 diguanylate cyclase [Rhodospirillum sp.]MCF8500872.1 diguanylate cyclase [Rhodospirillum sp.]
MTKNRFLASLSDCAQILSTGGDWPGSVRAALASVGKATGVSRVWVFQLIHRADDHVVQDQIFEYAPDSRWSQLQQNRFRLFRSTFECSEYRDLVAGRIAGQPNAFRTQDLPECGLRDDMFSQGILAMATAPIMVGGTWWGTLGLDDCERAVDWSEDDIAFLQTMAGLIAGSIHLERQSTLARQFAVMEQYRGAGLWELDLTTRRLWCSDTLFTMLGYPPPYAQMTFRRLLRHVREEDRGTALNAIRDCLDGASTGFRMDVMAHKRDGDILWVELITDVTSHASGEGMPLRLAGLVLEAGDRKAREQELNRAALTDPLTGLPNRRAFRATLERVLHERQDRGAMLMLDIDYFKRVNDTLGHAAGDDVLRAIGRLLRASLKDGDQVARLGGEEFALYLPLSERDARRKAELLRRAVEDMSLLLTDLAGNVVPTSLTISIGMAQVRPGQSGPMMVKDLLTRSDRALYTAKGAGRNQVIVDDGPPTGNELDAKWIQSSSRQTDDFGA